MKLIIDLPEKIYKRIAVTPRCASTFDAIEDRDVFVKAVQKGTVLSKDATNGDIIKTLFPDLEQDKERLIQQYGSQSLYDTYEKWCSLPYKEK